MKLSLIFAAFIGSATLALALPVEIAANAHNTITATVKEQGGKLRVSGAIRSTLPGLRLAGSHVVVELIGPEHRILTTAVDRIGRPTRHPALSRYRREPFAVTFSGEPVRQATLVRVVFHNHSRAACPDAC